jgi:hypothetical protein
MLTPLGTRHGEQALDATAGFYDGERAISEVSVQDCDN